MATDPRWPITKFGMDLTKAVPNFIQGSQGVRVSTPSLVQLPFNGGAAIATPTIVTVSSYTVLDSDTLIIIERNAPAATSILLDATANRAGISLLIVDWSTNVTEHIITVTPNGAETIMRQASWQMVSNDVQLTAGVFYPVIDLNGWII